MASSRRQSRRQIPGGPSNVQEEWLDAMIRHQIGLLRNDRRISSEVIATLDAVEDDMRRQIRDRLKRLAGKGLSSSESVRRLQRLVDELEGIRRGAHADAMTFLTAELQALAIAEPAFISGILRTVVPVQLAPTLPDARRLRAIVTTEPFDGRLLKEWGKSLLDSDVRRITTQLRIGLIQGEGVDEIARRVVGSRSTGGMDGVTQITRRDARAIVRTTANGVANSSAEEFFRENQDILGKLFFVATLDGNTTPICRSLDGESWELDDPKRPRLPLHVQERSRLVPLLDAEALGKRPTKAVHRKQMLREFARENGISPIPRRRGELPRGTKTAFDAYERVRTKDFVGRTFAKTSYEQFLRRQRVEFQEDVLGKTKARLFRRGDLPLSKFVDETGAERTLRELARTEAQAFRAAGLDPEDFL